jgi:cytochrome P450
MTQAPATSPVPAHVPPDLVREFDHHREPVEAPDCFSPFDRLYGQRVFWSPLHGGFWVLTRAEDISEALHRPDVFSSHPVGIPGLRGYPRKLIPEELDPPEHGKYRRPLAEPFAPKSVAQMGDEVEQVCIGLIDPLVDRGGCELLEAFARPYPTIIFTKLLGLPTSEAGKFIEWTHMIIHAIDPEVRMQGGGATTAYLMELIADRAANPRDDLVTHLLNSEVDGRPMTQEEVLDTCFLLFIAGLDTTTSALAFCFRFLAENPDARRQLVEEPTLIQSGVEELLRMHAFVNSGRYVTQDVEFCGVTMKAGDPVLCSGPLSTRDPEVFSNPTVADLRRRPNPHQAFGAGPHRCLGSHLARRELTAAITHWLARIPEFRIPDGAVITAHGGNVMGIDHLPLVWP